MRKVEPIKLICAECSKEFFRKPHQINHLIRSGRDKFYCSTRCSYDARPSEQYIKLNCAECSKEFERPQAAIEYYKRKTGKELFYCSSRCSGLYGSRLNKEKNTKKYFSDKLHVIDELSPFRWYLKGAQTRTKHKNNIGVEKFSDVNITVSYLKTIWEEQNGLCPITGWKLTLPYGTGGWIKDEKFSIRSASLDRIDNTKGYVEGNVRFISVMANYARNKFADEDVIEFGKAIASYQNTLKSRG